MQDIRQQNHILLQRLLDLQDALSPLNVIFDSLEQSANPLLLEYISRANKNDVETRQISFESAEPLPGVKRFVRAWEKGVFSISKLSIEILEDGKECVIIIDSATPIFSHQQGLIELVSNLRKTRSSLIIVCHLPMTEDRKARQYCPQNNQLLHYLATAVIHVNSLKQHLLQVAAVRESKVRPVWGLEEECEGIVIGPDANSAENVLIEVEYRRRSGKPVELKFILEQVNGDLSKTPNVTLAQAHHLLQEQTTGKDDSIEGRDGMTFSLHLTRQQRKTRGEVVLPYVDAQSGGGRGGRILYDMDRDDDFDDEEDEL